MQFQAICSKANKKLTLSLSATDIEEARALLHGQGYSIMELKEKVLEAENPDSKSNYFYFDIIVNGQMKTGSNQMMYLNLIKNSSKISDIMLSTYIRTKG